MGPNCHPDMSIDNYFVQQQTDLTKAKLTMMLPDPTRYSPTSTRSHFLKSQPPSGQPLQAETKLSLPSIRELLNPNESQSPSFSHLQPQVQQVPQQYLLADLSRSISYQNHYIPQHSPIFQQQQQQGDRIQSNVLVVNSEFHHPQPQLLNPHQGPLPQQLARPVDPQRPVSASSTSSLQSMPSNASTPYSPPLSDDPKDSTRRKKRQNLPRQTTLILLNWLSEHLDRPYPNSREKYELLIKTRLNIQQLDNWFINARRRKISILKRLKENEQPIALTF